MKVNFPRICAQATTVAYSLVLSMGIALADPAIVMGRSICDNQADSFDYQWLTSNVNDTKLFFLSGNTSANGAINPVGHDKSFNLSHDIYIAVHGAVNVVDAFSGTDFATLFVNNHKDTPNSVTFYVCQSGTVPRNGVSSMASVALSYPGNEKNSTLISAVNAPAPNTCPALAVDASEQPFNPIQTIAKAVYRTDPSHTSDHDKLLGGLLKAWSDSPHYPGTTKSYEKYCHDQLDKDPTGAWVPTFIGNVTAQFGGSYLSLINTNYSGSELKTCGPNIQCD